MDWRKAGLKRAELREAYWTGSGCITLEEQRIKYNKEKEAGNLRLQEESRLNITLEEYQKIANEKVKFTGKRNYEYVREILQHMKMLKNGEELVKKMVEEYKIKYANRRLLLGELNKIWK